MDFPAFRRHVGANVKRARWAAGLTQEEAAAKKDLDRRHLQKIEAGEIDVMLSTLHTLAAIYGTPVAALVEVDAVATKRARERMAVATAPRTGRKPRRPRSRTK